MKPKMNWDGEQTSGLLVIEDEKVTIWTWTEAWTWEWGRIAVSVIA